MIVVEKIKREDVKCGLCGAPLIFTLIWDNGKYSWTYECEKCSPNRHDKKNQDDEIREEFVNRLVRSW